MLAATFNKRKSLGNQKDSPQSSKKFKPGVTPKKQNGTPPQTPNQLQKQNQTPGKGFTPGKKQPQASPNIKKELVSPSPKMSKLEKFSGTSNLNSSQSANIKKEPAVIKKQFAKQAGGQQESTNAGKKGKPKQNSTSDAEEKLNRHKRRRDRLKHKRAETRGKFKQLIDEVTSGDPAARQKLEEKVSELEKLPEQSKNCRKKISTFKRILSGKTKANKNNPQPKQNQQIKGALKNQQVTPQKQQVTPQKQQKNKQNQLIKETAKVQQQSGGKQKQNLKKKESEQEESTSEVEEEDLDETSDDEEAVEASDDEEAVAASDDEEAVAASDEEVVDEESSEENEDEEQLQESSEDDEETSEEEVEEGSAEEEEDDDDQIAPKKNKKFDQKQGANKNKQDPKLDETVGKKSRYVVFVGNLPYTATKEELTEHFKKAGDPVDIRIPTDQKTKKPRGFAYVELKNEDSYQRALSLNHTFLGGRRINVLYTQGGKKKTENQKVEMKAKNLKLQAMRKQGMLTGSVKADQKRSVRRAKKQQFEKRREGA